MGSIAPSIAPTVTTKLSGRVVEGRRLGRLLGAPTANIALDSCDPDLFGSWAAVATTGDRLYRAIAHLGVRPSVGDTLPLLEVHLFEFDGDLYGHHIHVELLRKVSAELRLDSLDLLRVKIATDVREVRRYFDMPILLDERSDPGQFAESQCVLGIDDSAARPTAHRLRGMISGSAGTINGSAGTPRTTSTPAWPRPPIAADIAPASVTVASITLAPPSSCRDSASIGALRIRPHSRFPRKFTCP